MIEIEKINQQWKCRFSATLENIDAVDDLFAKYIESLGVDIDIFGVRILVRESLLNAVAHGSNTDPDKDVHFTAETDNDGITLTVRDSGQGFLWKDKVNIPDDFSENGRGLALMNIYSDDMSYNEKGNELMLRKYYKVEKPV